MGFMSIPYWRGKSGRLAFFLYGLLPLILILLLVAIYPGPEYQDDFDPVILFGGLSVWIIIPSFIFFTIRRFHDLGKSGLFFFLVLIPFVNLGTLVWLLFDKGKEKRTNPEEDVMSFEEFLNVTKNASQLLRAADVVLKDQIARLIYLNVSVDSEKVVDYQMREPFKTYFKSYNILDGRGERT
jgi:uncharacterized membrane protein YhaH (DUF805 family)